MLCSVHVLLLHSKMGSVVLPLSLGRKQPCLRPWCCQKRNPTRRFCCQGPEDVPPGLDKLSVTGHVTRNPTVTPQIVYIFLNIYVTSLYRMKAILILISFDRYQHMAVNQLSSCPASKFISTFSLIHVDQILFDQMLFESPLSSEAVTTKVECSTNNLEFTFGLPQSTHCQPASQFPWWFGVSGS